MDPITLTGLPALPRPASTGLKPTGGEGGLIKSVPQPQILPSGQADAVPDVAVIERKREAAVRHSAQQLANVYVVSDLRFTIFKDSTGQYITRFTSLRDGKVTYIPEPSLLSQTHSSGGNAQLLQIEA